MNLDQIREFFGWCTLINFGLLLLSTVAILAAGPWVARFHGRLFHLSETELLKTYYHYLAIYKTLAIAFSFTPWLALLIMGRA